ncbi:glycosyltransferase 61 family protein [Aeromonas schubertii]
MFNKKEKIFIFGTGAGGRSFYKKFSRKYNVIGFIDNNVQRHGKRLFSKNIYPPCVLTDSDFDKVFIVSDYYNDISVQLKNEFNIPGDKVSIFNAINLINNNFIERFLERLDIKLHYFMCKNDGFISKVVFFLIYSYIKKTDNVFLARLVWLDQREDICVHVFRDEMPSISVGPNYIGEKQKTEKIILPRVSLYKITDAQVCSVSRAFVESDDTVIVERVQTASSDVADYSCGHLIYHENEHVIVRREPPIEIENGILISGVSETNYYHWMLEILTQFQFISEMPSEYESYPIVISSHSKKIPSIKSFIENLNINKTFVYLESTAVYKIRNLLLINTPNNAIPHLKNGFSTKVNYSYVRRESLLFLKSIAYRCINEEENSHQSKNGRIFLARRGAIRNYNQDEIIEGLEKLGFDIVYMEDLSFKEQVMIMSKASMIVGASGAAWTNIIFAPQGTKALCWMADKIGEASCFSNIAHVMGINMECIKYSVASSDTRDIYSFTYFIRPGSVFEWVRKNICK